MTRLLLVSVILSIGFVGCSPSQKGNMANKVAVPVDKQETEKPATMSPAQKLLKKTFEAHGGERYRDAEYVFTFRKKDYRFKNDGDNYRYESVSLKDGVTTVDVLDNGNFIRTVDGDTVTLDAKQINAGTGSLNSVIYFATLPAKLIDPAVNLALGAPTEIKGQKYEVLQVSFDEEGGGSDHEDQYCYWVNAESGRIDYLAYNYQVNGGGVRFRSAYNPRVVDGIVFQDYINYKAAVGTELETLPKLYEAGELKELSRIETEDVVALKN